MGGNSRRKREVFRFFITLILLVEGGWYSERLEVEGKNL